jgi:PAS domain S-box-containing protein
LRRREQVQLLAGLAALVLGSTIALLLARRLGRSITQPLLSLKDAATRFGSDDLSHRITVIGADAVIRYQSPAIEQVLGYPTQGIIGRSFLDLIDPHDQDIARQLFEPSRMQPGVPTVGEVRMRPREDVQAPRHFEMTATDLLDDSTVRGLVLNTTGPTDTRGQGRSSSAADAGQLGRALWRADGPPGAPA